MKKLILIPLCILLASCFDGEPSEAEMLEALQSNFNYINMAETKYESVEKYNCKDISDLYRRNGKEYKPSAYSCEIQVKWSKLDKPWKKNAVRKSFNERKKMKFIKTEHNGWIESFW